MMRRFHWLAACLSLSVYGCGTEDLEPAVASETEARVLTAPASLAR
ncbi:hypothetical protein [Corallococcus interemptor]|nr:hypothetical protein [Corallococcus interemptor]